MNYRIMRLAMLLTGFVSLCVRAVPDFQSGTKYHIVCRQFTTGCVTDGAAAGQQTPLYYLVNATTDAATYWTMEDAGSNRFYIRNALTGQYVTYDGVRQDNTRRYVSMTVQPDGNKSLWTFAVQDNGYFTIRNVGQSDHLWDVRVSSYVVGTYSNSGSGNTNQLFAFYDENGQQVQDVFVSNDPLSRAMDNLRLGNYAPAYASDQGGFYLYPTAEAHFGTDLTLRVSYQLLDGWGTLKIDDTEVENGTDYVFHDVTGGKNYTLTVTHTDGTTISCPLTFTSLPVVRLYGSFGYNYASGNIIVQEPDAKEYVLHNMKAKWRGGITNGADKHKRNYHVKFLDDAGEKMDQKFFGLRNDNSWLLEACQVDMSRVRNRIVTDLWNDFSTPPYYAVKEPKALTGTRGRFVELVLNDEYRGIYCMTEAMDRKQMKLKKYDETTQTHHGQLWKSKDWSYAVFMGHNSNSSYYPGTSPAAFNNHSESWDQYYVKYPDFDDVNPTDWQTLWNAVNFVCTSSDANFRAQASQYFDLPLLTDYYILMETILSTDNHGKNMYFAVYDKQESQCVTFGVWDMDAVMGQRWSDAYYHSTLMQPEQSYTTYITNNEHGDYNLFRRLRQTDAEDFNMQVRLRYRDLRDTYLKTDAIIGRFEQQLAAFKTAGADSREYKKWSGDSDVAGNTLNFDTEMNYLRTWITKRMDYLDKTRFDIASLPTDIHEIRVTNGQWDGTIFDIQGRKVAPAGTNPESLPPGLYILNGRKIAVGR
ncbi:MAG: hypothetical protein E7107_11425 [Prevotella sp.]|nr:hypothetical protein [Prevotella sp.]